LEGVGGRGPLKSILKKQDTSLWTVFLYRRIGFCDGTVVNTVMNVSDSFKARNFFSS
jgi:hypothetical protein